MKLSNPIQKIKNYLQQDLDVSAASVSLDCKYRGFVNNELRVNISKYQFFKSLIVRLYSSFLSMAAGRISGTQRASRAHRYGM